MKPMVRHHYKGSKMALWLTLIPQLHRSDGLGPLYHQLDDFEDRSSFEEGVTRWPPSRDELLMTSSSEATTTASADWTTMTSSVDRVTDASSAGITGVLIALC